METETLAKIRRSEGHSLLEHNRGEIEMTVSGFCFFVSFDSSKRKQEITWLLYLQMDVKSKPDLVTGGDPDPKMDPFL